MLEIFKKMLGGSNEAAIRKLQKTVDAVEALEKSVHGLTDAQLQAKTAEFKQRLKDGQTLDDILPEAFATVREAAIRTIGQRHYRVQLLGGIVLHQGRIAEMKTGEGKTLVATLPAYLNALAGNGVHIVTVNDYLAKRDSEWMGKIHRFLGLTVGLIVHDLTNDQRRAAYACDITYGTNNELGFDYLRDNMVIFQKDMVQRGHPFAIVDEVDSILIDEARTPLIISGQGDKSTDMYEKADRFAARLRNEVDYSYEEKEKAVTLTEEGTRKAEQAFGIDNLSDVENTEINHHIIQALKAHVIMKRDIDYVVQNGEVVIVDEFTGRLMVGRRYSDGLHQAIEAKEKVKVERESKTLATITFQNYFRMYKKLSGMTGTAKTEEDEFQSIYNLDVVQIPTNKEMIRKDMNDLVYKTKNGKFKAVVEEIITRHQTGQPILVGTVSVETSEMLSHMLELRGVTHEVLNAKFHQKEAEIVAQAGHFGTVTIATNMAGRGTDILLGGNPDYLARRQMRQDEVPPELIEEATGHNENVPQEVLDARARYNELYQNFKKATDVEHDKVIAVGGLHIIGTERHESRRIDNQLRGRAGRQGDPGSTKFFISLEDDVMRLFGSERIQPLVERLGMDEDQPMEAGLLTKQIESAQKRIEGRNFDIRKHVLQFDDVMNQQREVIYGQRRQVLEGANMRDYIQKLAADLIHSVVLRHCTGEDASDWDLESVTDYLEKLCIKKGTIQAHRKEMEDWDAKEFEAFLVKQAEEFYGERESMLSSMGIDMREFERVVLLSAVDARWMDHIDAMDHLRDGIGLRAYGQRDPVTEYKLESFDMFEEMVRLIREDTLTRLYQARVQRAPERHAVATPTKEQGGQLPGSAPQARPLPGAPLSRPLPGSPQARPVPGAPQAPQAKIAPDGTISRNGPCPCGSGKKYKHCCGKDA